MKGGPIGNKYGWKGGKHKCNGYFYIYKPEHPCKNAMGKGYVKQSRLIMEEILGRYLLSNEHIHHLNGIRDDDRIENLVMITKSKHMSIHHKDIAKNQLRESNGRFTKEVVPNAQ